MKKNNLFCGLIFLIVGILFIAACIMSEGKVSSMFAGFAGGAIGGGLTMTIKYLYRSSPKRIQIYKEKLEEEKINLEDERNEMYRDKSGRYAYKMSMTIIPVSMVVFTVLDAFNIYKGLVMSIYLLVLWIVLYVIGIVRYRKLKNDE